MQIAASKQTRKYHLSMAGEFFVAAELQRRGIPAAVTYGNAKSADVIAFSQNGERCVVIEVKSTAQAQWVVGNTIPQPSPQPWIFVHVPEDAASCPSFYVLLQSELRELLLPGGLAFLKRFKAKTEKEFTGKGVVKLPRVMADRHKNAWEKIRQQLETEAPAVSGR